MFKSAFIVAALAVLSKAAVEPTAPYGGQKFNVRDQRCIATAARALIVLASGGNELSFAVDP